MQQPLIGLHFSPDLNLNLRLWGRSCCFCWQVERQICTRRLSHNTIKLLGWQMSDQSGTLKLQTAHSACNQYESPCLVQYCQCRSRAEQDHVMGTAAQAWICCSSSLKNVCCYFVCTYMYHRPGAALCISVKDSSQQQLCTLAHVGQTSLKREGL